jgi:DNA-binding CsgD family transcriptional regulator
VAHLEAGLPAAEGHPDLEADIHYRLAIFSNWDTVKAREHAERTVELAEASDRPSLLSSALFTLFGCELWLGLPPRIELLERGLEIEPEDNPDATTIPGIWWLGLDRADDARRRFRSMLQKDRARGDLTSEADLLTRLAEVELFSDNFAAARELADAATAAARQQGSESADPARRVRLLVDIHQGRHEPARGIVDAAYRRAAEDDDHVMAMAWLVALALLAASEADNVAVEHYTALNDNHLAALKAVEALRLSTRHERPEALVALGRLDEADAVLATLDEQNARIPRPWLRAAIARGRAQLFAARGNLESAVKATDDVLSAPPAGLRRFDRARTILVRGQVLRRARARREAASSLDEAARLFEEIGAPVWAARARAEGERLGRMRAATEGLTPTELQVATLVASGLTSREAAEQLSVSPKTVEAHLARSYSKLGIRSRAELGRLMAARTPDEAGAV